MCRDPRYHIHTLRFPHALQLLLRLNFRLLHWRVDLQYRCCFRRYLFWDQQILGGCTFCLLIEQVTELSLLHAPMPLRLQRQVDVAALLPGFREFLLPFRHVGCLRFVRAVDARVRDAVVFLSVKNLRQYDVVLDPVYVFGGVVFLRAPAVSDQSQGSADGSGTA